MPVVASAWARLPTSILRWVTTPSNVQRGEAGLGGLDREVIGNPGCRIGPEIGRHLFDQSVFVSKAVAAVVREGAIAAGLTALMILLFLGTWRSTLVVMISIPLAVVASLVVLYVLGDTINTMTLGGLALAGGILVDDSTVTIENIHRLLSEEGRPLPEATLYGAAGIAVPTLVSTWRSAASSPRSSSCKARLSTC